MLKQHKRWILRADRMSTHYLGQQPTASVAGHAGLFAVGEVMAQLGGSQARNWRNATVGSVRLKF